VNEKLFICIHTTSHPFIKINQAGNRFEVSKNTAKQLKTFIFAAHEKLKSY